MQKTDKIYIAGHSGLVGSAICNSLINQGYNNIITKELNELDLINQQAVDDFFLAEKPDYVFLAAAKVGGILANKTYPAEFIYNNTLIAANVINSCHKHNVKKLLNLGSSCIYPKFANQPIKEEYLLTSELEPTNEAYAIAKITAIKLCRYFNEQYNTNFISLMPTNQYGPNDNFNMETAHILPMLLRRFHLSKLLYHNDFENIINDLKMCRLGYGIDNQIDFSDNKSIENAVNKIGAFRDSVIVWGDGSPYRELMHSDDLADACIYLMKNKEFNEIGEFVNITTGTDIQIKELINIVKDIVGFNGQVVYDKSKPNGTPRKLMDATRIKYLGWQPKINLIEGIHNTYRWYMQAASRWQVCTCGQLGSR